MLGLGLMLMNFCVEMVGVGRVRMRSLGRNREGWLVFGTVVIHYRNTSWFV